MLLLACLLAGCGKSPDDDPLAGVSLSPEIAALRDGGARTGPGRADVVRDLDLYAELQRDAYNPSRQEAASDRLYALWLETPTHFMWPELVMRNSTKLDRSRRLVTLFNHPELADSTTAVGAYMRGWRTVGYTSGGEDFLRAWNLRDELDPVQRFWLALKLAWVERLAGNADRALALAIDAMPEARTLGGRRAERVVWTEMARTLKQLDRLDDALHAVVVAERLAAAVAAETDNISPVQSLHLLRADILAARRESDAALALYEACTDTCLERHMFVLAAKSLNRGGILTASTGQYETGLRLYRRALTVSVAAKDSLATPKHLMNIARRHRLLGRLDSCLVYQRRAETWVAAYPNLRNRARLPLMQAEYFAQIGDYATVDSLLAAASALTPNMSTMSALAELHLQIIKDGEERGSPGAAYRSIALLDSLRDRLGDSLVDRNVVVDLDLHSAAFLTRQGQIGRAVAALDRADAALKRKPDPTRAWRLACARGNLARRRDDLMSAETAFREATAVAEHIGDPDLCAASDLQLGAALLDQGRHAEARDVLDADGGRFRTRLAVRLMRGVSYSREGRFNEALDDLTDAHLLCTPWSPRDLVGRIELETGRARAGAGHRDEAREAYAALRSNLPPHDPTLGEDDYYGDLRRDLVEADLSLATHGGPLAGEAALRALNRTCDVLPDWFLDVDAPRLPLHAPQIVFFCGEDVSFRWDIDAAGPVLRRLPGERALNGSLGPVLADLGRPGRPVIASEMIALIDALGGTPTRWAAEASLIIVPDGILHAVPWAALPLGTDGTDWLDRGPILVAEAPAARSDATAASHPTGRLLALGADGSARADAAGLSALRHAEREAREIYERWPVDAADLHVGVDDGDRLRGRDLSAYDVIHVASHARIYRGSSRRASLLLGDDGDAPLDIGEIRSFDLSARLVFLSCCEAADGSALSAGLARAALARGFLEAGAHTVVAPTLVIDDEAARHMAGRFYDHWLSGKSAAASLRAAQLSLRDGDPRWSHPFYWAFYLTLSSPRR